MKRLVAMLISLGLALVATGPHAKVTSVSGNRFKPAERPFTDELVKTLKVPAGFQVNVFAKGLENPRMMRVGEDGTVYVTRQKQNDVLALVDRDGDGVADGAPRTVVSNLNQVHGVALFENKLYLAAPTMVWSAQLSADGSIGSPQVLISNLPDGGQHRGRTIGIGPDRLLYISIGSSCNDCAEANPNHATMMRARLDGSEVKVFARGLRDTIGFDWHPVSGELWGADNGADWKGDQIPPEELNWIKEGGNYGWPICYGKRIVDEATIAEPKDVTQEDIDKKAYCARTEPAVLTYDADAAPIGMVFYNANQFPEDYRGDAFIAYHGSWNRTKPVGYKVVRTRFQNGKAIAWNDFLSGFINQSGTAYFGRPAELLSHATARC
ncbi:MAG: PQQ-dependent sugar dehydrogenase [Betaproteobacteria bacterium]|nr:PQQ-dependent sugar dehydrogenase [Betaproteobacteria bacterium]